MKGPDPSSKTTKRRKNRGFKSLEVSSRKHRRAKRRSAQKCMVGGKELKPGEKMVGSNDLMYTGGGSLKYH